MRFVPFRMPCASSPSPGGRLLLRRPATGSGGATGVASTGSVKRLAVTITGTTVTPAPAQVDLPLGSTLELVVTSDHDDALARPRVRRRGVPQAGVATTLRLTGKEAGSYEVETHDPALTLLTVAVR